MPWILLLLVYWIQRNCVFSAQVAFWVAKDVGEGFLPLKKMFCTSSTGMLLIHRHVTRIYICEGLDSLEAGLLI